MVPAVREPREPREGCRQKRTELALRSLRNMQATPKCGRGGEKCESDGPDSSGRNTPKSDSPPTTTPAKRTAANIKRPKRIA